MEFGTKIYTKDGDIAYVIQQCKSGIISCLTSNGISIGISENGVDTVFDVDLSGLRAAVSRSIQDDSLIQNINKILGDN